MAAASITDWKQRIALQTGLDRSLLDRPSVASFVGRRCRDLGLADEPAYLELASRHPDELEQLIQEVSVAETWLFRYPASFRLLVQHLGQLRQRGKRTVRMLSIACATGEEPYCMVMAATKAGWPLEQFEVDAVDRHASSLAIARQATYGRNSLRDEAPAWARQWMRHVGTQVQIDPRITAAVNFHCLDILNASPLPRPAPYDVIFCRNLLIYLSPPAREQLAAQLASSLMPDGLLFVGHAEQSELLRNAFEPVTAPHTFALRHRQRAPAQRQVARIDGPTSDRQSRRREPWAEPLAATEVRRSSLSVGNNSPTDKDDLGAKTPPAPDRDDRLSQGNAATLEDARGLANSGRLDEALLAVEALLSRNRGNREIYEVLGSVQLGLSHLPEARDAFQKVLYFAPDHEEALLQLAIIYRRLGDGPQASRHRRRAARAHQAQLKRSDAQSRADSDERPTQPR